MGPVDCDKHDVCRLNYVMQRLQTVVAKQHAVVVCLLLDPEATPKYFFCSLVGKSRSLFSLSELFRDSVHWTT